MTIFGGAVEWRSTHRLSLTIQTTAAVTDHSNPYEASDRHPQPKGRLIPPGRVVPDDMAPTGDELAGIVDLFGGLAHDELREAVREAAFRAGTDPGAVDGAIDAAIEEYRLVACDFGDETVLVPGPAAFPELPDGARDLPHIMDVERRDPDREDVAGALVDRFRRDAEISLDAGDHDRAEWLIDVSYDLETWAPVDLATEREQLDAGLDESLVTDVPDDAGEG